MKEVVSVEGALVEEAGVHQEGEEVVVVEVVVVVPEGAS